MMKILSQRDIRSALITGLTTGFIAWRILLFLGHDTIAGFSVMLLVPVIPLCWLIGVQLGYILGRWIPFFNQFGRFVAVGFTNAAVDFGVLNLLIAYSGHADGIYYTAFKTTSFWIALIHSYIWNRTWSFDQKTGGTRREFFNFAVVALLSLVINVGTSSAIVRLPHDPSEAILWANIAAVAGSAAALIFSFAGFRLFVFRR